MLTYSRSVSLSSHFLEGRVNTLEISKSRYFTGGIQRVLSESSVREFCQRVLSESSDRVFCQRVLTERNSDREF